MAQTMSSASRPILVRTGYTLGVVCRHTVGALLFPWGTIGKAIWKRASKARRKRRKPYQSSLSRVVKIAAAEGLPGLADALADPNPMLRVAAAQSIAELRTDLAEPLLNELLNDPAPGVRVEAARAAAKAKASGVVFTLILALADEKVDVRMEAKRAIEAISGHKIEIDVDDEPALADLDRIKAWWKERRVAELAIAKAKS